MNYILIFGKFGFPSLGIEGAAIGTLISRLSSLIFIILYFYFHFKLRKYLSSLTLINIDFKILKKIINSNLEFFKNKFIAPLDDAIITGIYGSQRILNGKPRSPHYGIDFAGKIGTPIKAMANGVVTLAENDLYYTGATLIFDHGHGISTLYMHMDKIFVEEGDIVKQGDIIGTVGSSGRSTGPHLDIRLNWFGIKLDPSTVIDIKL